MHGLLLATLPAWGDEFDGLRLKWRAMIAGDGSADQSLTQVRDRIAAIGSSGKLYWNSLQTGANRTALWTGLASASNSGHISSNYSRLRAMALAWATPGQSLYGNQELLQAILSGLEWMDKNRYYTAVTKEYDNWWDWEIGAPQILDDVLVLLYDQIPAEAMLRYTDAIERFVGDPQYMITKTVSTGGNLTSKCVVSALRAVVAKDATRLQRASDALSPVFAYVTSGDGFYEDGSFIQHTRHPYTGSYGNVLIVDLANTLYLLNGSTWQVRDPAVTNLYRWVFESFEPLIYRGAMMDIVRGRAVSRSGSSDHAVGHSTMAAILRVSQFAPEDVAPRIRSMLKEWYQSDTSRDWSGGRTLPDIVAIYQLLCDESVARRGELTGSWVFAGMDRAVHLRPGWGFAVAMHSSRVYNYESINSENLRGWHTGDGMTYLYTDDLKQFADNFWPAVDPQRLPGTTVIAGSTARQSQVGGSNIAGGATLDGWSAVMYDLRPDGRLLDARKSWFLFDNEVVALGSDIRSTAAEKTVETVVENRMVEDGGEFTAAEDGRWAHLAGGAGYYFPNGAGWQTVREERQGAWSAINSGGTTTIFRRMYQTIWFDHGVTPADGSYAYVLLPERTRDEVMAYAAEPPVQVVANSATVHAAAKPGQGVRAANFFTAGDQTAGGIACDAAASVLAIENGTSMRIGVADPTQANSGTIHLEFDRAAAEVVEKDDAITVTQLAPVVKLSVAVKGTRGRTLKAALTLAQ